MYSKANIFQFQKLIIPINENGHWALGVVDFSSGTIFYFDSIYKENRNFFYVITDYLRRKYYETYGKVMESTWNYCTPQVPQQKNNVDCGVFVCKFAECILSGIPFLFSQSDIILYREKLKNNFLNNPGIWY